MPSFHVAGGLMVTWVFRGYRRPFVLLLVLNVLMIASTFMTGAHYFVDVLSTLVMFALSVGVYRVMTNSGRSAVSPLPLLKSSAYLSPRGSSGGAPSSERVTDRRC
jgi:hypothetical protein